LPNINKYKYLKALNYTYKLHYNQFRKKTNIPYFFHLSAVSNLIIENGGTTIEAIAGLLHDAVEDQGGQKTLKEISKKFGKKVEKIVLECTDTDVDPKPPWDQRKLDYLKEMKSASQSALLVSLCDKLHNLTSIIEDYQRIKNKLWKRFNAPPKKLFWYYEQLYFNYKKYLKKHQILKKKYFIALKDMRTITLPLA